jgi:muramoyltetrapeptide carboxypeptidase LdcA involved in peptidoglycan recycling
MRHAHRATVASPELRVTALSRSTRALEQIQEAVFVLAEQAVAIELGFELERAGAIDARESEELLDALDDLVGRAALRCGLELRGGLFIDF